MGNKESSPGLVKLMQKNGFAEANQNLLVVGGGINSYDNDGLTALHRAILANSVTEVERLIELGADANVKTEGGWSCFHMAAKSGNMEIMAILLGKNVPVSEKAEQNVILPSIDNNKIVFVGGSTALHIASQMGNTKAAHVLVSIAGGAEKVRNDEGLTAEEVAKHYNQNEVVRMLHNDIATLRRDFERHRQEVDDRFRHLERRLTAIEGKAANHSRDRRLTSVEKSRIKDNFHILNTKMNVKQMICLLYNRCILNCEDMQSLRSLQGAEDLQKKFIINNKLVKATVSDIAKVKEIFKDSGHGSLTECLP